MAAEHGEASRIERAPGCGSTRRAAGGLRQLAELMLDARAGSRSPTSGCACACSSSAARSPPPRPRWLPARRSIRPTSACSPRRRASRSACSIGCRTHLEHARRRARSWCWPHPASRAQRPGIGARESARGPTRARASRSRAALSLGPVGYEGAREHHPDALEWYARAGSIRSTSDQLAWKARAALRAGNWPAVRDTIDRMPPLQRHPANLDLLVRPRARGAGRGNRQPRVLPAHCRPDRFLWPARERGARLRLDTLPQESYVPTEAGGRRRAPATPGSRARWSSSASAPHRGRARVAVQHPLLRRPEADRGSRVRAPRRRSTTARSTPPTAPARVHNFALRYPVPYRDVFREYAKTHGLDDAWVLGLVRQESRFITDARSAAGAAGLMQVMPRTARFVASRIGLRNYQRKSVTEIETNVTLGTGYMRLVLDQLGQPGARFGRLQRRPVARPPLARHSARSKARSTPRPSRSARRATTSRRSWRTPCSTARSSTRSR